MISFIPKELSVVRVVILDVTYEEEAKGPGTAHQLAATVSMAAYRVQNAEGEFMPIKKPIRLSKIIHEPLWHTDARPQVFSPLERKIIPYMVPDEVSYDYSRRVTDMQRLISMTLGLMDYSSGTVLVPQSGMCFTAFMSRFKGKWRLFRYFYLRDEQREIFPEPFTVTMPSCEINDFVYRLQFNHHFV